MLDLFIKRGARLDNPPETVSKIISDPKGLNENYRKATFIIQAACAGDVKVF